MPELEGVTLGHYLIQRQVARGGMSEIYLAQDIQSQQMVAIKLVHTSTDADCERFRREVKVVTALKHEHILPALDDGEYDSWCYMVTPYIAYGTLKDRLLQGPLSLEETGQILEQLVSALQFAHEHGVVHRDIKPSNILLRDGHYVYLADFGLVKRDVEDCSLTQTGYLIGTPEYMAPELVESPASRTSDIYALGILLYQMLTGRLPFKASTPIATIWKQVHTPPERPSMLNPALPYAIEHVILRALAKHPPARFQTAYELLHAYQQALSARVLTSVMAAPPEEETQPDSIEIAAAVRRRKKPRSSRLLVAAGSLALLCIGLLFGLFVPGLGNHLRPATPLHVHAAGPIPNRQTVTPTPSPTSIQPQQSSTIQTIQERHDERNGDRHGGNDSGGGSGGSSNSSGPDGGN